MNKTMQKVLINTIDANGKKVAIRLTDLVDCLTGVACQTYTDEDGTEKEIEEITSFENGKNCEVSAEQIITTLVDEFAETDDDDFYDWDLNRSIDNIKSYLKDNGLDDEMLPLAAVFLKETASYIKD